MRRAAVQNAEPHTSNLVVGRGVPLAEVAVGFANTNHVNSIASHARVVGMRRRYLFSPTLTDPCIAANVIKRNVLVTKTTEDRAGHSHDRDRDETRRFL